MTSRSSIPIIIGITLIVSVAQHAWYWPQLPDRVATHFGADGQPNDWMSKTAATMLIAGLQVGIPAFLMIMNSLSNFFPEAMLNIPNKEYWLSPDRRDATLSHMNSKLTWIILLLSGFMIVIAHVTFVANRDGTGLSMPVFGTALAAFLLSVFFIAAHSMWHFRRPADNP